MALLHEEEDNHNREDMRSNKSAGGRHSSEPEKPHLTGQFVILTKFSDHVLLCLASSLSNVVRQVDRQADKTSSLGDNLEFNIGIWQLLNNAIIGFAMPRPFHESAFLCVRYLYDAFYEWQF